MAQHSQTAVSLFFLNSRTVQNYGTAISMHKMSRQVLTIFAGYKVPIQVMLRFCREGKYAVQRMYITYFHLEVKDAYQLDC